MKKEQYAAPALRLLPLQLETGFCASTVDTGNLNMGYNSPFWETEEQLY
jgi:hypothetical protein